MQEVTLQLFGSGTTTVRVHYDKLNLKSIPCTGCSIAEEGTEFQRVLITHLFKGTGSYSGVGMYFTAVEIVQVYSHNSGKAELEQSIEAACRNILERDSDNLIVGMHCIDLRATESNN